MYNLALQQAKTYRKMEQKKNPQADLNKNRGLFFITGLVLVLSLVYAALEWKTYDDTGKYDLSMNVQDELIEEVPFVQLKTSPPPPPQVAPEIIEIVEDDEPIVETIIESTEPDPDEEIKYEDIVVEEVFEDVPIPFDVIEDVPVFPGCENDTNKKACFQKMLQKHIVKNFRYPEVEQELGIQGRVSVMFVIQKDGSIGEVRMRGPNKNLEKEAARIIDKLPKMTPGKQRGTPVRVPFSIPITFKLQ